MVTVPSAPLVTPSNKFVRNAPPALPGRGVREVEGGRVREVEGGRVREKGVPCVWLSGIGGECDSCTIYRIIRFIFSLGVTNYPQKAKKKAPHLEKVAACILDLIIIA